VPSRPLIFASLIAVLATGCATRPPEAAVSFGGGVQFVPEVADSLGDVGLGNAVAVDADGVPFLSYFGFEAVVPEGTVQPTRPIGAPFLPAVQLTTVKDGLWTRGAVMQAKPAQLPPGITVPFTPATVKGFSITPENTNGIAIAIGEDGTKHVVWASSDGIWYASVTDTSDTKRIFELDPDLAIAGPLALGRPSVTVDDAGSPWVAFTAQGAKGIELHVATKAGDRWHDEVVDVEKACADCPPPSRTAVAVVRGNPVVAFVDATGTTIRTATLSGAQWVFGDGPSLSSGATTPIGLSMASAGDTGYLAYYAGGSVTVATSDGTGWDTAEVAQANLGAQADTTGNLMPTTGLAVDDGGSVSIAWQDVQGAHLATGSGTDFTEQETQGTEGGVTPSVAVTPDGATTYLAWYDLVKQDFLLGTLGEVGDLLVANPSPPPSPSVGPPPGACGEDGTIVLDLVASGLAFDPTCLVAPANEPFVVDYDNKDAGVVHNLEILTEAPPAGDLRFKSPDVTGPSQVKIDVPPQDPGSYYFQCVYHPATMFGTFALIEAAKGK
jgi:cupredoxin-like protein